eukprot:TRINITY_DN25694_c0_g1_i1.p1 TRINITY_DN25694_c0_g1~~TRINITY_DN25694_c0_g1_i1.p1  ORF type:complete len:277 (+),score=21.03 TRINITY_DN25694_c0_g1_i1:49-831(+)
MSIALGTVVELRGLTNNRRLNGMHGRVMGVQGERIVVEVEGMGRCAYMRRNLRIPKPVKAWCHRCRVVKSMTPDERRELVCPRCRGSWVEIVQNRDAVRRLKEFRAVMPGSFTPQEEAEEGSDAPTAAEAPPPPPPQPPIPMYQIFVRTSIPSALEDILSALFEGVGGAPQPPPASRETVAALPTVPLAPDHLTQACPVCQENFQQSDTALQLPCTHLFHKDCIIPWLDNRNTCPTCRHELPTDDPEYEEARRERETTGQ